MDKKEYFLDVWRPFPGALLTSGQVCMKYGVTRAQLRHWERIRAIRPVLWKKKKRTWRGYSPAMELRIRRLAYLLKEGMTLKGALAKIDRLAALEERREKDKPKPEAKKDGHWMDIFE